jgi:hypothetical protein
MATTEKPKNPDVVKLSEINKIIEEEGLLTPQVLSEELTVGQVRGIAGRRRTQVLKRLGELGIPPASGPVGDQLIKVGATIKCYFVYIYGVPILICEIVITLGGGSAAVA